MRSISKFDIVKSEQKDKFYRIQAYNILETFLKQTFTNPNFIFLKQDIKFISDFIYYSLTTLSNRQTIGQEYFNLILYKEKTQTLPLLHERLVLLALRIVFPYLIKRLRKGVDQRKRFTLDLTGLVVSYLKKINVILFYLGKSTFFNLENRLVNVNLLSLNMSNESNSSHMQKLYLLFGLLESAMLLLSLANEFKELLINTSRNKVGQESNALIANDSKAELIHCIKSKCPLCLELIVHPTLTTCGHLFCWDCIHRFALNSTHDSKCPSCRNVFEKNKLIYLYNFK